MNAQKIFRNRDGKDGNGRQNQAGPTGSVLILVILIALMEF